jgi:hypothetical protein
MIFERSSSVRRSLRPVAGAISEPVYPFGIEAVEALSYGLRMTAKFLGDPGGA